MNQELSDGVQLRGVGWFHAAQTSERGEVFNG